jgi:hypothetical protein
MMVDLPQRLTPTNERICFTSSNSIAFDKTARFLNLPFFASSRFCAIIESI